MKKQATKEESKHMDRVQMLGCIACRKLGYLGSPAEIHHTRFDQGGSQRSSHFKTLPLCPIHHRHGKQGEHVSVHGAPEAFKKLFGTEQELLDEVKRLLEEQEKTFIC